MHMIKVDGTAQPFTVTPRVLDVWMKKHEIGFDALGAMTMQQQLDLMWMGFKRGSKDQDDPLTEEAFEAALDSEEGFQIIKSFQEYFMQLMEKMLPDTADQEEEKVQELGN